MRIVFLGAPGTGKGTQATILKDRLGIPHISTGELLRAAVHRETELGLQAKAVMERGELVSDELVLGMLRERLQEDDCGAGFILDGYPRNLTQGHALAKLLAETNQPLDVAVQIAVDPALIVERLSRRAQQEGRADDTTETIERRMNVYEEQTAPLVKFYAEQDKLKAIDGEGTIEDVAARVLNAVNG